jgi:hypothetical protein
MTLSHAQSHLPVALDQITDIQYMAEAGRFGDALLRVRKVKALSPPNTFLVAIEKQLERLLALSVDAESTRAEQRTLLDTLPRLLRGVTEVLQTPHGSVPRVERTPKPPAPPVEKSEKDMIRAQLKEEYFRSAEEYLKRGAYGSALVEIHRVRIIAPEDQTTVEYERIIRQLVELKQREGEDLLQRDSVLTMESRNEGPSSLPERGPGDDGPPDPQSRPDQGKPASPWRLGRLWMKLHGERG